MKKILLLSCAALLLGGLHAEELNVSSNFAQRNISPYLNGMHFVYPMESDSIYANGNVANWALQNNIGTARFPGGTVVKSWSWDNPTGNFNGDRWDPAYNSANDVPASEWMSVDEYLNFCTLSGIEPLMGVNIHSGEVYNRRADSAQRAKEQVLYTMSKGWDIKYWYLGNEDNFSASQMAAVVIAHASKMREANPNIKIIVTKNKPATYDYYYNLMLLAGTHIDAVECHFKWGNEDGLTGTTYAEWLQQSPIGNGSLKTANYDIMKRACKDAGYPSTLIMDNEWGPGAALLNQGSREFDKYEASLVMVDMLLEMYRTGYDMACYWNNQWNSNNGFAPKPNGHLMDSTNNYAFNPVARGFELLKTTQEQSIFLGKVMPSPQVYGFACRDLNSNKVQVFLINKSTTDRALTLKSTLVNATSAEASCMKAPGEQMAVVAVSLVGPNNVSLTLPALSFTRITMTGSAGAESGMRLHCRGQEAAGNNHRLSATASNVAVYGSNSTGTWVQWILVPAPGGANRFYVENVGAKAAGQNYRLAVSSSGAPTLYGANSTGDWTKWELTETVQGYTLNNIGARSAGQNSRLRAFNGAVEIVPDSNSTNTHWDVR